MLKTKPALLFFVCIALYAMSVYGQEKTLPVSTESENIIDHLKSISTDPLLPLFNSFAILYEHGITPRDAFLLGFWYGKATETYPKMIEYPGYIQNFAPILAWRRYFWRGLHAEYQLYPGYSIFHENAIQKDSHSFTLFTEFRAGYRFDFSIGKLPLMLNLQWPVGFTLYESNQPESFREINRQDPVFYIFWPNIYVGVRF